MASNLWVKNSLFFDRFTLFLFFSCWFFISGYIFRLLFETFLMKSESLNFILSICNFSDQYFIVYSSAFVETWKKKVGSQKCLKWSFIFFIYFCMQVDANIESNLLNVFYFDFRKKNLAYRFFVMEQIEFMEFCG